MKNLWSRFLLIDLGTELILCLAYLGFTISALLSILFVRAVVIGLLAAFLLTAVEIASAKLSRLPMGVFFLIAILFGYFLIPFGIVLVQFGSINSMWLFRRAHADFEVWLITYLPYFLAALISFWGLRNSKN